MSIHGYSLLVSDWLINHSLKFYSRIAPAFAKGWGGGAIVEKIPFFCTVFTTFCLSCLIINIQFVVLLFDRNHYI